MFDTLWLRENIKYLNDYNENVLGIRLKSIDGVTYTPNGKHIITYGYQLPLRIYDAATGKLYKSYFTNASGDSILGNENRRDYEHLYNPGILYFDYTKDNKYLMFKSPVHNNHKLEFELKFNDDIFDVQNLKFVKPNLKKIKTFDNSTYFYNDYAINLKNPIQYSYDSFTHYRSIQHIFDSSRYYKYQCQIDSLKEDKIKITIVSDTNCVLVTSKKFQCLWYYKTNRQVFASILTQANLDSIKLFLKNTIISIEDTFKTIQRLNDYFSLSHPASPYLITKNLAEAYYKIWDVHKGVLVDSVEYVYYKDEWNERSEISESRTQINLSAKGKILFLHKYYGFMISETPYHNYSQYPEKIFHISNTKKKIPFKEFLANNTDETIGVNKIDSNTVEVINLLTAKVIKTITLKGYSIEAAFYSPQKKSFIGVATKNKTNELYLYIFKDGRILDLNKLCKNVQELKPLED